MIKKILKRIYLRRQKRKFLKNAAADDSLVVSSKSRCFNQGERSNVKIGKHCYFLGIIQALCGGKIEIGENLYFGPESYLQAKEKISIGNNVIIANNVIIVDNNNHPTSPELRLQMSQCDDYFTDPLWKWDQSDSKPIVIKDNVWIGRDVRILKGVTIGEGSIVGIGSIVTHDVPPYSVAAGNPAIVVKKLKEVAVDEHR